MQSPPNPIDRITFINITLFVEALLLLAATIGSVTFNVPLKPALHSSLTTLTLGVAGGLVLALSSAFLLWLGKFVKILSSLREITFQQLAPLFYEFHFTDLILLAVVSGFCEEVLFRGVMQPKLGLLAANVIFALLHCPSPRFISYTICVFLAGLLLGWSFSLTGSLWVPICAHCVSNIFSMIFLRYASHKVAPPPTNNS